MGHDGLATTLLFKKIPSLQVRMCEYSCYSMFKKANINSKPFVSCTGLRFYQMPPDKIKLIHRNLSENGRLLSGNRTNNEMKDARINEFGIQMINSELFNILFKNKVKKCNPLKIGHMINELQSNTLFLDDIKLVPQVNLKLPKLNGETIEEHFENIGREVSDPYKKLLLELMEGIPDVPELWEFQPGWTKYTEKGTEKVSHPQEDAFVFDIEVCCQAGQSPTLATAVSRDAWYGWVSNDLITCKALKKSRYDTDDLIPLESTSNNKKSYEIGSNFSKKRIGIGHNVSFDRSKIKEQYWLEQTGMRFLDTMSMHISVSGITSYQKALLKAGIEGDGWSNLSSLNSLSKVHQLYCGQEISKEYRDLFISGQLNDIRSSFQESMSYCAMDTLATFNVFQKIFPLFLERFPHPVTLAGMLEIQMAYLPVNKNWARYIYDSQNVFDDFDLEARGLMSQCAKDACELLHNDSFKSDMWLWDQMWCSKKLKLKKNTKMDYECEKKYSEISEDFLDEKIKILSNKYDYLTSKEKYLPSRSPKLPGYPEWFGKLCDPPNDDDLWVPEPTLMSSGLKIMPKLLRLTWKSLPVHHEKVSGWGYLVPYQTSVKIENEDLFPTDVLHRYFLSVHQPALCSCQLDQDSSEFVCKQKYRMKVRDHRQTICKGCLGMTCGLIKLPHKDGPSKNVGNPLSRDFINKFSENALSADSFSAKRILEMNRMVSYWRNNRERIESQFVCWLKPTDLPKHIRHSCEVGAILPNLIVCGTLTRRAVEPTWMTASNSSSERIGSELRSMVQAPPGYSFVGADVDSQELWIASLLGDSFAIGLHGATPLGWMTLNGQKSAGTDMHSVTAKAVGISRDNAKVINYARIYGAGEKFAQRLLKQFNDNLSDREAAEKAEKMMSLTKGKKVFILKDNVLQHLTNRIYSKDGALELCNMLNKDVDYLFERPQWLGGTESSMFNCLEVIATKPNPETPFLNSRLSRALEPLVDSSEKYLPTRINWVVQSGAVDFLHLMVVSMRWLLGPKPRFCLSFHDEVRYLIKDEDKYKAALALHVTNLLTRAFCVSSLGMVDLPMSVAFFSSVEVDQVLRKETTDDNKTPSNPFGLFRGYGIPLGESLDIYTAIKKANGIVGIIQDQDSRNISNHI